MSKLDSTRLRELLSYDPNSGVFTWVAPTNRRIRVGARTGQVRPDGYSQLQIDGRRYLAHRLAWCYVYGDWPNGELDHINGLRSDNRVANLRVVTRSENMQNQRAPRGKNPYLGVSYHRASGRWAAQLSVAGRNTHLGLFDTPEQAQAAYTGTKKAHSYV